MTTNKNNNKITHEIPWLRQLSFLYITILSRMFINRVSVVFDISFLHVNTKLFITCTVFAYTIFKI